MNIQYILLCLTFATLSLALHLIEIENVLPKLQIADDKVDKVGDLNSLNRFIRNSGVDINLGINENSESSELTQSQNDHPIFSIKRRKRSPKDNKKSKTDKVETSTLKRNDYEVTPTEDSETIASRTMPHDDDDYSTTEDSSTDKIIDKTVSKADLIEAEPEPTTEVLKKKGKKKSEKKRTNAPTSTETNTKAQSEEPTKEVNTEKVLSTPAEKAPQPTTTPKETNIEKLIETAREGSRNTTDPSLKEPGLRRDDDGKINPFNPVFRYYNPHYQFISPNWIPTTTPTQRSMYQSRPNPCTCATNQCTYACQPIVPNTVMRVQTPDRVPIYIHTRGRPVYRNQVTERVVPLTIPSFVYY